MDPPLKASDDHEDERVQFSYFTHFDEYQRGFNRFLEIVEDAAQADEAYNLYRRLALILDRYQEQSYLLDPFLERMLIPPLQKFKERAKRVVEGKVSVNGKVWQGLPALIYHLIKTRGAKTAVRFFPHTPADLNVALDYLATDEAATPMSWETRYIVLLWLSLVAMLPFDLAQFDRGNAGSTFTRLENAGKNNLEKAGLEREGAALLLTRLYARKDYQGSGALYMFMVWGMTRLIGSDDPFRALGVLHVLCETTKTGSGGQTAEVVYMHSVLKIINESDTLTSNTLVRKWATKLESRLGLCKLPPPKPRKPKGKLLQPALGLFGVEDAPEAQLEEDIDVPDSLDDNLDSLLKALQDRDTVVRWVAAKGLARVAERLPDEYVSQILEAVIELYSTYAFDGSEGSKPLLPISEPTWHGATLACAEFARRGLIGSQHLPVLMGWLKRALHYDPVKITGPVGSNVRDAACYVLWAMARAQDKDSFEPYSLEMARHLVTVSVFDREVHVRRAASAAFQEHVGRTGLFPHGIDTVRKADFFAVSMRRSAFTIAAPQVAEHEEYRGFLINHLITVSLTHTDAAMRQPAAVALRRICEHDLLTLGPTCVPRVAGYLQGSVAFHVHGALLALAELADAYKQSKDPSAEVQRLKIFEYIVNTPSSMFLRWRHGFLLQAACIGLSHSLSNEALAITDVKTPWKDIVWAGIKYRGEGVPEAAAVAMRAASQLVNCNPDLQSLTYFGPLTWVTEYPSATPPIKESTARILGLLAYQTLPHGAVTAIECLLKAVNPRDNFYTPKVEPRQAAYEALQRIILELKSSLPEAIGPKRFSQIYETLVSGLSDYTTDQRGDVGSWIRMSCMSGLVDITSLAFDLTEQLKPLDDWLPPSLFQKAVSGTLKQAVERLDNVRLAAVNQLIRLIKLRTPDLLDGNRWSITGRTVLQKELIDEVDEMKTWADGAWLFPKLVQLLEEPVYMVDMLQGFILSIGSRGEGVAQPASVSLVRYANDVPVPEAGNLVQAILKTGQTNFTSNNIFIPVLQTLAEMTEGGVTRKLAASGSVVLVENILSLASRNADKIKSVPRLNDSAKIVIGLLAIPSVADKAVDKLPVYLKHGYPKVRSTTAENLYLALQGMDIEFEDEVEDALLQTTWTDDLAELQAPVDQITAGLRSGLSKASIE